MWKSVPDCTLAASTAHLKQKDLDMRTGSRLAILGTVVGALGIANYAMSGNESASPPSPSAVNAVRKQVKMLDDLYKTAVVLITQHYVNGKQEAPAGTAAKMLFKAMKEKGHHEVRLLDATGQPYNDENIAVDEFEKSSIQELKAGKSYVEKVVTKDGKYFLRALTPIPVVLEKCTLCHENYKGVKSGSPIGALAYTIPIE